jgi:DNA-binding response OmpR family regulator
MHLLVVEDEDAIAEPLVEGLRHEGFDVTRVAALWLGHESSQAPQDVFFSVPIQTNL